MWFRWKMSGGVPGVGVGRIYNNLFLVGLYGFRSSSVVDFRFFCRFMKIWWRFCMRFVIKLNQFGQKKPWFICINLVAEVAIFPLSKNHVSRTLSEDLAGSVGGERGDSLAQWFLGSATSSKTLSFFSTETLRFFFCGGGWNSPKKGDPFSADFVFWWHGFCKTSWVVLFVEFFHFGESEAILRVSILIAMDVFVKTFSS